MSGRTASKLTMTSTFRSRGCGTGGTSCHAMRPDIDCDVADFDFATWVRPVSGSDQGQFVRTRMNEPYLLDTAI